MREPIRKRIIIDLESPQKGPVSPRPGQVVKGSSRSVWPRVLLFVVAIAILGGMVAAFGAFYWWQYFQTTPGYTLAVMIDAAQRSDSQTFDRLVDDESIAMGMITKISDKASSQFGMAFSGPVRKQVERLLPSLLPGVKQKLRAEIEAEIRELGGKSQKPFVLIALGVSRLVTITTDGSTAKAIATLNDRRVEILLRLDNEQWKVVDFNDDVLTQKIVNDVLNDLPTVGGLNIDNILKPGRNQNAVTSNSH